jgi:Polysaccharide pyruvyl transferase.
LIQEHYHKLIKPLNLKRRYVLIYFHKKAQKYESEIIHYLAQKLDLEIISIGISYGTNVEIANKKILHAEPVEWLSWFKNADFIFTDSYHGMIFSVIFQKQFWVVSRKDKNIKINDLLVDIKLEERILNINNLGDGESPEQLDALLEPVDYSQSFQILNQKLEQSTQFLSSLLQ